jgi:hypothetical protein
VIPRPARQVAAAVAAGLVLLGGCTKEPDPLPSRSPMYLPTPPETSLDRQQRLDFEAAEKSYRTFMAEKNRLSRAGGTNQATAVMKSTAGGPYLAFYIAALHQQKAQKVTYTVGTKIGYVRHGPYSTEQLTLEVCEDGTQNKVLDKNGKQVDEGRVLARSLYARHVNGTWKMWDGDERGSPKSCDSN